MSRTNIIRFHSTGMTCNVLQQIHKSQLSFCHLLFTYIHPAVEQCYVLEVVVKPDNDKAGRKQKSLKYLFLILKYDVTFISVIVLKCTVMTVNIGLLKST